MLGSLSTTSDTTDHHLCLAAGTHPQNKKRSYPSERTESSVVPPYFTGTSPASCRAFAQLRCNGRSRARSTARRNSDGIPRAASRATFGGWPRANRSNIALSDEAARCLLLPVSGQRLCSCTAYYTRTPVGLQDAEVKILAYRIHIPGAALRNVSSRICCFTMSIRTGFQPYYFSPGLTVLSFLP